MTNNNMQDMLKLLLALPEEQLHERLQTLLQQAQETKVEEKTADDGDDIDYEAIRRNREEEKAEIEKIVVKLKKLNAYKYYEATDSGVAQLFADLFPMHRYNVTIRNFMYYDGTRWIPDKDDLKARHSLKLLCEALQQYAERIGRDNYKKDIKKINDSRGRQALLRDVKDDTEICNESLDTEDYRINVQNGVLDLSGDEPVLLPHSPKQLMSKICNAEYDPDADGSEWNKFIDDIMMGDAEKIKFLQKIAGMMLTGDTSEEKMYMLYGPKTRNGKSTLCETLLYLLGDYGIATRPETLAQKNNVDSRQASGDIARMAGVRYCCVSEPKKRMTLDVALIKNLTGGDGITARHLNAREFTFRPRLTLVFNTNHLPAVSDMTLFTSNRVQVLTFDRQFAEAEQDGQLKERLREPENLNSILNWCVAGWFLYKTEGLNPPQAVITATREYADDSDKIGTFWSECMVAGDNYKVKAGEVYKVFGLWCDENGYGTENMGNFFEELKRFGVQRKRATINGQSLHNVIVGWGISLDAPGQGRFTSYSPEDSPFQTATPKATAPTGGSKEKNFPDNGYTQGELPIA